MTQKNSMKLSRRQVLAGLGTIGVASAGAGLGTTAFYSDRESLQGWYEAGRVDLLLDYRTTYMPWERYDLQMVPEERRPPVVPGTDGMVYQLDSVPDFGEVLTHDEWGRRVLEIDACATPKTELGAQLIDGDRGMFIDLDDIKPLDRGETTFSLHLCGNPSFLKVRAVGDAENESPRFEEDYRDNVTTPIEPEMEFGDMDDIGELQDFMHVCFWYDPNCNNRLDMETQTVCVQLALDNSDSMDQEYIPGGAADPTKIATVKDGALALIDAFEDEVDPDDDDLDPKTVGVTLFNGDGQENPTINPNSVDPTMDAATLRTLLNDDYNGDQADADGSVAAGIDDAAARVADCADFNAVVVVTNGVENIEGARTAADNALAMAGVDEVIMVFIQPSDNTLTEFAGFAGQVFEVNSPEDSEDAWLSIRQQLLAAQIVAGEEVCLYEGPLSGFLDIIDDEDVILPPATGEEAACTLGDASNTADNCFKEGVHCYALEWYIPCKVNGTAAEPGFADLGACGFDNYAEFLIEEYGLDTADDLEGLVNITQTDTVHFGLVFTAEQCRHNTSTDIEAELECITGEGFGKLTFEDESQSWFGRLRYGDSGGAAEGEVYVGNEVGDNAQDQNAWPASPATGSFTLDYVAGTNTATLSVDDGDGVTMVDYVVNDPASTGDGSADEIAITAKAGADQTVSVSNVALNGVPAGCGLETSDGIQYLKLSGVDTASDFTLTGDFGLDYNAGTTQNERPAIDIDID